MGKELTFSLAVGQSRLQKRFRNESWTWEWLLERVRNVKRTGETMAEYAAMPKDRRAERKDAGAFIGGFLKGGSRKDVVNRQLICLDVDFADPKAPVWEAWKQKFNRRALMYPTHSSTPEAPRYRMVIPLSEAVPTEQYQPIARKIAEALGIEQFDDTTYEPQRIMYWPSVPKDAPFEAWSLGGEVLTPGEVLGLYRDWRDVSQWPVSARAEKVHIRAQKKMQPIAEKRGVVGAFCRAWPIEEAIAQFVPDYAPSETVPGRYTYVKGTTSNGVVIYEDSYSFSHHDTDPAGGVECNAFDLVRLHRFKQLDAEVKEDAPVTALPSYKAMVDFALRDARCLERLNEEQAAEAAEVGGDFADEFDEQTQPPKGWEKKLDRDRTGYPVSTYKNIELILRCDEKFRGRFGYDEFARREVALRDLPWRKVAKGDNGLKDIDDAEIRLWFGKKYHISGKDKIWDCVLHECHRRRFHPVKSYLEGLCWDGKNRISSALIDYFGCEDCEYIREITKKTFLAAVTRIYEPGAQFDTMLTLKGPQGCGKSSFFRKLARGWFSDSLKDIRSKDAYEGMQGVWIIEMGELSALRKADAEVIKSFLSGTTDRFRVAYGRRTAEYPRQCIFVATTNECEFLRDRTGNRRFWIADIPKSARPKKDVFALSGREIDQMWAEAKALYDLGTESVVLPPRLAKQALEIQEAFLQDDPRAGQIKEYLDRKLPHGWDDMSLDDRQEWLNSGESGTILRTRVCAAEIWCEVLGNGSTEKMKRFDAVEINQILDSLSEWERVKTPYKIPIYGSIRGFQRLI